MLAFSGSPLRAHKAEPIWISMGGNPRRSAWRGDVKGASCNSAGPRSPSSISPRRMSAARNEQPFRGSVIQDHEPGSSQATRSGSALLLDRIGRCCRPLDGRQGGCRSAPDYPGPGCSEADVWSVSSGSMLLKNSAAALRPSMDCSLCA
jgi:hypothetical protein